MKPDKPVLRRADYVVEPVPFSMCRELVAEYHYAKGGASSAVVRHGLFHRDDFMTCRGVAWWLQPVPKTAKFFWPSDPATVLSLTRLVVHPDVPQNGATFLLAGSTKLIQRDPRWECLGTYADEGQGHTGAIYRAAGWEYFGCTQTTARWVTPQGRQVSTKADAGGRTVAEMRALGYEIALRSRKHRFRKVLKAAARGDTRLEMAG